MKLRYLRSKLQFSASAEFQEPKCPCVCVSVSPSVKIMVLPDIWFFRNLVRGYRTMKLGNWHGRFFREKSISLIIHENRFWPFFRLWDLGYAWNFTGILSKWFSLTLHMLLSQQKSESALFRILTTSICVKTRQKWRFLRFFNFEPILTEI